jgi:hypothetical protein
MGTEKCTQITVVFRGGQDDNIIIYHREKAG